MGYTQVAAGQVIGSAEMNLALSQGVLRFTDANQRQSQLPSPAEGQMSWLVDVDHLEIYRGNVWRPAGAIRMGYGVNNVAQNLTTGVRDLVHLQSYGGAANTPGRAVWTTDGKVRVPYSGSYLVSIQAGFPQNNVGERYVSLHASSDGTTWSRSGIIGGYNEILASTNLYAIYLTAMATVFLNANQYLAFYAYQKSGGTLAIPSGSSGMAVMLLGAD